MALVLTLPTVANFPRTARASLADRIDDFKGSMRELRTLRFTCSKCGSRDWAGWLFVNAAERDARLEGLVVSPIDGSRPTF